MDSKKSMSLNALNLTAASDTPFEFELTHPVTEKGLGVFISVLGDNSEKVKTFTNNEQNRRRRVKAMNEKRGKDLEIVTAQEDDDYTVEMAVIRVTGWRGLDEECTPENVRALVAANFPVRERIIKESANVANFMKL